ncbi:carbohydrate porin [Steroidobacter sp.]|uniref:carbohydrate porin n=1 Tax=Steroidobacter sp. TaxID=1978227 RepID=UPI001A56BC64|nr:carbohydrate porin [Steroidobacter sp.]MBL8271545.1 carbohydrate porin [Steroidobacter sp.]
MALAIPTTQLSAIAAAVCMACAAGAVDADDLASSMHFEAGYTGDFFANRRGGLERGERHLGNLDVAATLDAERLWGLSGLTLFVSGQSNNGGGLSDRFIGDSFAVSNIDAPKASRLLEAGADWSFGESSEHSLRVGLLDLNADFDSSEPRALYINSIFGVGQDLGQSGENGPSIFPTTSLGVRLNLAIGAQWHWLNAAFDGVPGNPDDPTATTVRLNHDDGLLLISELQHLTDGPVQKLALGLWGYTRKADYLAAAESPPAGSTHNHGWYVSADSRLGAPDDPQPWSTSFRVGHAQQIVNCHDWSFVAALNYDLPRPEGREQTLGIGAAWVRTSSALRSSAEDIDDYETAVELTWRATLTDWLTVQPDVQYIVNPGSQRSLRNALVVGLRFEVAAPTFSW